MTTQERLDQYQILLVQSKPQAEAFLTVQRKIDKRLDSVIKLQDALLIAFGEKFVEESEGEEAEVLELAGSAA